MVFHKALKITSRKVDEEVAVVKVLVPRSIGNQLTCRKEPKTIQHRELISVRAYLENTSVCRRKLLLEHLNPKCAEPGEDP